MTRFWIGAGAVIAIGLLLAMTDIIANSFWFFAAYVVLQYVVLATAWNIMGGYMGYVNFGSAGFLRHRRLYRHRPLQSGQGAAAGDDPALRHRLRADGSRHGLSHAQTARGLFRHRHAGARRGARDPDGQLGLCRRRDGRLCDPPAQSRAVRRLRQIPDLRDAGARRYRGGGGALDRARQVRARPARDPRRRGRRRMRRHPDAQAQTHRDHPVRLPDGHSRGALPASMSASSSRRRPSTSPTRSTRSPCR